MTLLPQTTELADKAYLDLRLEAMEQRLIATIHEEISKAIRPLYFAMTGAIFTSASLAFAAARF